MIVISILLIYNPITEASTRRQNSSKLLLFNTKSAFSKLNYIKRQITNKPKDLERAKLASSKLEKLQDQANLCVEKANNQLTILNNLLESLQSINGQTNLQKKDEFKYFKTKKENYTQQLISCRLFLFQSQETLTEIKKNIQRLTTQTKLTRATPIWSIFSIIIKTTSDFNKQKFYQASGLYAFTHPLSIILLITIIAASLLLASFIRKKCFGLLNKQKEKQKSLTTLISVINKYASSLLLSGSISGYLTIIFIYTKPNPLIANISYLLLIYLILLTTLSFIFSPPKPATPIIYKLHQYGHAFFIRSTALLTLILLAGITTTIFNNQYVSPQLTEIAKSLFLVLLSINIAWICWLFVHLPISTKIDKKTITFTKNTLVTILFIVIFIQALGYYRLASHIIFGSLLIFLALLLFYFIIKTINKVEKLLYQAAKQHLKLKYTKKITEFIFIKIAAYTFASYGFTLLLLRIFGASLSYIEKLNQAFMDGFVLITMKIIPFQIILALLVFGTLLILGKWIVNTITKKRRLQGEKDTQDVMASLLGYISFCVAFIIAMIIAGVDFTGLAFIVGALSVGIGLGLQNIVNNFISGIILLVEKSIKPGDRIIINDKEGFVKQISLRSTQITTLAKEDIIVPNSDFITNQVINYTFRDELTRVKCQVGVSYGSDVDLVKKTLLEIASLHPDVACDEENKPAVLFKEFADSSLNFALYCTIYDANKKYQVISDLNTTIFKKFKELNIEIAYPQLDVHMID